jgi:hypothetical protein
MILTQAELLKASSMSRIQCNVTRCLRFYAKLSWNWNGVVNSSGQHAMSTLIWKKATSESHREK